MNEPIPALESLTPADHAKALADCIDLARAAIHAETPICVFCKNSIFFYEWHIALTAGHVYSEAGRRDIRIVGACEYCMDDLADKFDEGAE